MLTVLKFGLQQRVRQVKKEAPVLPESRAESGGRGRNEWAASAVCGGKRSREAGAQGRPHPPAKSPAKISSRRATPSSGDKVSSRGDKQLAWQPPLRARLAYSAALQGGRCGWGGRQGSRGLSRAPLRTVCLLRGSHEGVLSSRMTRAAALKTDDKEKGRNRPTGEDAGDQCRQG